ncbi:hypothetical protein ABZP36_007169, partial [Zizania latifolia]
VVPSPYKERKVMVVWVSVLKVKVCNVGWHVSFDPVVGFADSDGLGQEGGLRPEGIILEDNSHG